MATSSHRSLQLERIQIPADCRLLLTVYRNCTIVGWIFSRSDKTQNLSLQGMVFHRWLSITGHSSLQLSSAGLQQSIASHIQRAAQGIHKAMVRQKELRKLSKSSLKELKTPIWQCWPTDPCHCRMGTVRLSYLWVGDFAYSSEPAKTICSPLWNSTKETRMNAKRKQKEQFWTYDHWVWNLGPLLCGDLVWIPDRNTSGTVVQLTATGSYQVSIPTGSIRRNRRHLTLLPEQDPPTQEHAQEENTPQETSTGLADNPGDGVTITRSGQVSVPPTRLDPSSN